MMHPKQLERSGSPSRGSKNYSFLIFLHGPRSCTGERLARLEMACLVAAWVGAFDTSFSTSDYVLHVRGGITTKPRNGLPVRVTALN
jgi:cytochrome P450